MTISPLISFKTLPKSLTAELISVPFFSQYSLKIYKNNSLLLTNISPNMTPFILPLVLITKLNPPFPHNKKMGENISILSH
mgnify:CR=1 FL=1